MLESRASSARSEEYPSAVGEQELESGAAGFLSGSCSPALLSK